jgi:hypothetical protein
MLAPTNNLYLLKILLLLIQEALKESLSLLSIEKAGEQLSNWQKITEARLWINVWIV